MFCNIKDFGAKGNGIDKDTIALQTAIDRVAENGGGTVYVPAGKYICGSLMLKDNITLELSSGAEIVASEDEKDFEYKIDFSENYAEKKDGAYKESCFPGLLCCQNVKNVTLRGGVISANDISYFEERDTEGNSFEPALQAPAWYMYKVARERITMILCNNCENLRIENMRIQSYPCYAAWIVGCDNIRVCGVDVKGRKDLINTDGFHFSECKNVMISSCVFECGDDCVAVDAGAHGECRDVVITNCIFNTSVHAVRVYTGIDAKASDRTRSVRNVSISCCTVTDAAGVLNINAQDGTIENVSMTGINATLDAEGTTFLISTQNGDIHNVRISNINVKGNGCGMIYAESKGDISRVRISDCDFVITPKTKLHAQFDLMPLTFPRHCHFFPMNFHFERAENVRVKDVCLTWTAPVYSDSWSKTRKDAFEKRISPTPISALEPKRIEAFKLVDCANIAVENSVCPDFDYER